MHHLNLFVRMTIFYLVIASVIWVAYTQSGFTAAFAAGRG